MSDQPPIDVDSAELRLLAQLAEVAPKKLVAAFNDPAKFSKHLSADEFTKYLSASTRLLALINRMNEISWAEAQRVMRANPALKNRMKAKGLI